MTIKCTLKHVLIGLIEVSKNLVSYFNTKLKRNLLFCIKLFSIIMGCVVGFSLLILSIFQINYWLGLAHYKLSGKILFPLVELLGKDRIDYQTLTVQHSNFLSFFFNSPISERMVLMNDGMVMMFGLIVTGFFVFAALRAFKSLCEIGKSVENRKQETAVKN